jgi:DNA topoisomerase-2
MCDQDHDGSHIKGLLINFFDHFYPSLLKIPGFLQEFITPIIRATKGSRFEEFFTMPEYETFAQSNPGWTVKYYKGLGTSTSADCKRYFSNLEKHVKTFNPLGVEDKEAINLAFNKKKADARKTWLLGFEPGTFLDQSVSHISISDFINRELILFSMADNIRSIPNVIDGLKPGQRKVLFGCFKRKLYSEAKVAQLVGYIAEHTAYRHGEVSLASTIVALAQDFVGSNNINILMPNGQFGSRLMGGKDCSSARYIFTELSKITRTIFHESDDLVLNYLIEEEKSVEPQYYVPIIPMLLVNGSDGIGTGWSTNIPNYNPLDLIDNIKRLIRDEPTVEMTPFYRNFKGNIEKIENGKYQIDGIYEDNGDEMTITELPIGTWTQTYKEYLESLCKDNIVRDFTEHHTEKLVHFKIIWNKKPKSLKLTTTISTNNMICFDPHEKIKKYDTVDDILKEFYYIRLRFYMTRKEKMLSKLKEGLVKIENRIRFIQEVVTDRLIINKRKKAEIARDLEERNYLKLDDYGYLLSMAISSLTHEKIDALNEEYEEKKVIYTTLLNKSPKDLWLEDLDKFEIEYEKILEQDKEDYDENNILGLTDKKKRRRRTVKNDKETKKISIKDSPTKRVTKKTTNIEKTESRKKVKKEVTTKKTEVKTENKSTGEVTKKKTTETTDTTRKIIDLDDSSSGDSPWLKY